MKKFLQRHRIFFIHFSFWCVYFSFFFYSISARHDRDVDLMDSFINALLQVVFMVTVSYLNYFYFLPRFLANQKLGRYLLEYSIPFALVTTLFIHTKRFFIDGYTYEEHYFYSQRYIIQVSLGALFIVLFVGMLKFAEDWFELEAKKKALENEKLSAELRFLKAQINPHFLFNTLNNLYYLAFTQSPNTTEVIAKLSQMMRYMIYESNHAKVKLSREIEYMENYISLEKLRLNNEIPIKLEVSGNPDQVMIVPLILITFLENAFKHGVSNNFKDAWIRIRIEIVGESCTLWVENSKIPGLATEAGEKSGIGLQNVQRRLELSYPEHYQLDINNESDHYRVKLKLQLT